MEADKRDELIINTANDIKWIKAWAVDHKALHTKYTYYLITLALGLIITFLN